MARTRRPLPPSDPVVIVSDDSGQARSNTGAPVTPGRLTTNIGVFNPYPIPGREQVWRKWTNLTWTAVTTNPSLGNGTLEGWFKIESVFLELWVEMTMGSTTTYGSGGWNFSGGPLPVGFGFTTPSGWAGYRDVGSGTSYHGPVQLVPDSGALRPTVPNYGGSNGAVSAVTATVPFTWASTDTLTLYAKFRYRS